MIMFEKERQCPLKRAYYLEYQPGMTTHSVKDDIASLCRSKGVKVTKTPKAPKGQY